jgi:hypothetical protein
MRNYNDKRMSSNRPMRCTKAPWIGKWPISRTWSKQLADNIAALASQKADADKQVAVLSQALEVTKTDLKASQNRAEVLSDENKLILQEKAVIQGQFKQLQESLSR